MEKLTTAMAKKLMANAAKKSVVALMVSAGALIEQEGDRIVIGRGQIEKKLYQPDKFTPMLDKAIMAANEFAGGQYVARKDYSILKYELIG